MSLSRASAKEHIKYAEDSIKWWRQHQETMRKIRKKCESRGEIENVQLIDKIIVQAEDYIREEKELIGKLIREA